MTLTDRDSVVPLSLMKVLADAERTVALQMYTPESFLPNELIMAVVVWMDPDTDGRVVVSGLPAGSTFNSSKATFNGMSIPGPLVTITLQIRVRSDPKGGMGLGMLLDSTTTVGAGTAYNDIIDMVRCFQFTVK